MITDLPALDRLEIVSPQEILMKMYVQSRCIPKNTVLTRYNASDIKELDRIKFYFLGGSKQRTPKIVLWANHKHSPNSQDFE